MIPPGRSAPPAQAEGEESKGQISQEPLGPTNGAHCLLLPFLFSLSVAILFCFFCFFSRYALKKCIRHQSAASWGNCRVLRAPGSLFNISRAQGQARQATESNGISTSAEPEGVRNTSSCRTIIRKQSLSIQIERDRQEGLWERILWCIR